MRPDLAAQSLGDVDDGREDGEGDGEQDRARPANNRLHDMPRNPRTEMGPAFRDCHRRERGSRVRLDAALIPACRE